MILCFSATGNSQYCAEVLADATDDSVVSINACLKHKLRMIDAASGERLGIVCPIYNWDIPWVIADFLKKCKFENLPKGCYVYAVFTCGKAVDMRMKPCPAFYRKKGSLFPPPMLYVCRTHIFRCFRWHPRNGRRNSSKKQISLWPM